MRLTALQAGCIEKSPPKFRIAHRLTYHSTSVRTGLGSNGEASIHRPEGVGLFPAALNLSASFNSTIYLCR
jgi:hypothetical protein